MGIADKYFLPLLATQIRLVALLDAEVAGVVAGAVVGVVVDIVLVHLADVAEDVGAAGAVVFAECLFLNEESGEAVELLLKAAIVLERQMADKHLLGKRGVAGVAPSVAHLLKLLAKLWKRDLQRAAQVERVEVVYLLGDDHDVVCRLVEHDETPLAVVDHTARGIDGLAQKGIGVGVFLECLVSHLQVEQTHNVKHRNDNYQSGDDKSAFLQFVLSHFLALTSASMPSRMTNVSAVHPTTRYKDSRKS